MTDTFFRFAVAAVCAAAVLMAVAALVLQFVGRGRRRRRAWREWHRSAQKAHSTS